MARRKRLFPFAADPAGEDAGNLHPASGLETKAAFPPATGAGFAGVPRSAPIADVAGVAAATAAMQEMADTLRLAREQGRMVLALPLGQVEAGYLVRDRISADPEEMAALVESLRARGQQTPIEVAELGPGRYGLISGWRRLTALRQLQAETGDEAFGHVLALLRRPDQAADAYVAMVEENEIRVGLSFWERARIVDKAVAAGVYPDDRAALRGLFASASRPKRSKIGSFLTVVRALDGVLSFPETIGERLGLTLAREIEADPALADRLRAALDTAAPGDALAEQAVLSRIAEPAAPPVVSDEADQSRNRRSEPDPAGAGPDRPTEPTAIIPGIRLRSFAPGRLVLEGDLVDEALRQRLIDWLQSRV